ncbi:MAG: cobalt-precorrin-5B (C(1))-methyltransferase CbiD [Coriobacteriales bacterium]|nr:cobalt-precorrin-5B (C(1))-methyltransferase CbiD [Coriobacteriales bacterium]
MRRLEHYVCAGGRRLRCGCTTGTCAAAATHAATELLLGHALVPSVVVATPAGIDCVLDVEAAERGDGWASCAVRKDAGDDPDVTDGVLVWARVSLGADVGVTIEGGAGVGRVTRAGLDQPVGSAAINATPRAMIEREARTVAASHGYAGGLAVLISIPGGEELAAHTFNPRLGIEGGLSVLGTSGIVRPMSEEALVETVRLELRVLRERGARDVLVVPGNYGRDYAADVLGLSCDRLVTCSNYLGAAIDEAGMLGFASMLVVGHAGKLVKVAAGIMNTHSRVADGRMEVLAAHAALAGAPAELVARVLDAPTVDAGLEMLDACGLRERATAALVGRMERYLRARAAEGLAVEAVVFSHAWGELGRTSGADRLLALHGQDERGEDG